MKYLHIFYTIILLLIIVQFQAQAGYATKDLFAYWPFDQSTITGKIVQDIAGNNNVAINGNVEVVQGRYAEAVEFDGDEGNYIELGVLEGFGSNLGNFSMDFWIKTEITPDWTTLFKTLTDGLSMAWAVDLNRTAVGGWAYAEGNTHFYIRDETGKALAPEIQADIYDGAWHHIAWVIENAENNECRIWVDGTEQELVYAYTETPVGYVDFQHPAYLGAANNRGNIERFCPAAVDELRLYTAALTEDEVIQNMETGAAVDAVGKLSTVWGSIKKIR
ncbi:hypothetical protein GF312_20280 [Candidatus Poribacteria bacterium]|nr:hypothetical protein [Candidatus Poribacteria bacterium]